jgi:hypothetical protein
MGSIDHKKKFNTQGLVLYKLQEMLQIINHSFQIRNNKKLLTFKIIHHKYCSLSKNSLFLQVLRIHQISQHKETV